MFTQLFSHVKLTLGNKDDNGHQSSFPCYLSYISSLHFHNFAVLLHHLQMQHGTKGTSRL